MDNIYENKFNNYKHYNYNNKIYNNNNFIPNTFYPYDINIEPNKNIYYSYNNQENIMDINDKKNIIGIDPKNIQEIPIETDHKK